MKKINRFRNEIRAELKQSSENKMAAYTGVIFVFVLAAVFLINLIVPDKSFSASENRMLQEFPSISVSNYFGGRLESKMESYVNDQFLMRGSFIKVKSAVDVTEGKLKANGVYRARDGYLIEDIVTPDQKTISSAETALKNFKAKYPKLNMTFLLAPNAGNIMSDKLPLTVSMADQNKSIDAFYKNIKASGIKPIDVRKTFNKKKEDVQLYYRTDHHWTSDGAYLAYKAIVPALGAGMPMEFESKVVKNDFAGTMYSKSGFTGGRYDSIKINLPKNKKATKPSVIYYGDTKKKTTKFYQLKNLDKKDAYTVFGGSNHPMYTIKTPTESNRRLLLIKDSYANSVIPMLAQHYREIVVVDPRYYFDNVDDLIASEGITDVLFLYNANTFFADDSLSMMFQ